MSLASTAAFYPLISIDIPRTLSQWPQEAGGFVINHIICQRDFLCQIVKCSLDTVNSADIDRVCS